jgi:hypothetical protein
LVKAAIKKHYAHCDGIVPSFGRIREYLLVFKPGKDADFAVPYNIDGDRAGSLRTVPRLGTATLSAGGQRLSKSIWSQHGHGGRD